MADPIRRAMLTVASYATGPDDLRQLLDALGLRGQATAPTHDDRCGTVAGYSRHHRTGETPCWECRNAYNAHSRARRRTKAAEAGREFKERAPEARCGTLAGLKRHYRESTPSCEPCREASRNWQRERRAEIKRAFAERQLGGAS